MHFKIVRRRTDTTH